MNRKGLIPLIAVAAMCLWSCSSAPATTSEQTDTDSLVCQFTKGGIEVSITADYPTADATLQEALAYFMHSMMPTEVADTTEADGQALLAACADAAWEYMLEPPTADDDEGIDITLGEGDSEYDSEIPTAEEREEYGGGVPRSSYTAEFPKVYDTAGFITWQCSWNLYAEGAAHPSFGITGATFRKADGQRVDHDLLKDTDSDGFRQLLKESLRQWLAEEWDWQDTTDEQLTEAVQQGLDINALPLPANAPYLLPEGVALPYQEYELTGGRDVQVLFLPYDKVKPYLAIDK